MHFIDGKMSTDCFALLFLDIPFHLGVEVMMGSGRRVYM